MGFAFCAAEIFTPHRITSLPLPRKNCRDNPVCRGNEVLLLMQRLGPFAGQGTGEAWRSGPFSFYKTQRTHPGGSQTANPFNPVSMYPGGG